ncbi:MULTISPECIES: hypothetical protein [unclassified Nocardia]|uniref:hypothetical protein n=1 Tax=unclassified Nocardia TaxID=2637762 RepID=UPI001CE41FB6|nr:MULTISPECIES: hypothetical protein [unclassified Nocardia]
MDADELAMAETEIRAIRDVIDTVEARLRHWEQRGGKVAAPRSQIYARVIYEVIASATQMSCGTLHLVSAPILDAILGWVDVPEGVNVFDRLLEMTLTS